jgi:two-component system OmpR family response regulator
MAVVLIVDDEPHIRQILAKAIGRAGHEVVQADSSDAALEAMERQVADVVFTDIQMPGRDGRWLTGELRKRFPQTAVVLATAVSTIEPQISFQPGALSYLVKPFELAAVLKALNAALAWRHTAVTNDLQSTDTQGGLDDWLDSLNSRRS